MFEAKTFEKQIDKNNVDFNNILVVGSFLQFFF